MKDKSRSKDKDYYYKYKALKYFLKNQNLKTGGSSNADTTDDLLSPTTNTNDLQLPDAYKEKFSPDELVAINEGDNKTFVEKVFENMSTDLKGNKKFFADLVNKYTYLINFIPKDIINKKEFIDKIDNVAEVFSQNNISIPYKDLEEKELIELIKKDVNILSISEVQKRDDYKDIINKVVANINPFALLIDPTNIEEERKLSVLKKYPALLKELPELNNDEEFIKSLILSASENYKPEVEKLKNDLEKEKYNLASLNAGRYKFENTGTLEQFEELKRKNEEKIKDIETQIKEKESIISEKSS